ncbi:MAG: D-2-hydroxyacid dehydrogenase [Pseudomonadales bacterium]
MTIKIAFLDRATIAPYINMRKPDFAHQWVDYDKTSPQQVVDRLAGCNIAIVNKVSLRQPQLSQLPDLQMIAVAATGTDRIDRDYCQQRGIAVTNIRNYATTSVPEHALSMILALRRNICAYQQDVAAGEWQKAEQFCFFNHPISDLAGNRLGIIGAGDLGQALARLATAIGMRVMLAERKGAAETRSGRTPFDEVIATSDVVSLHCPLTPETKNMIALDELRRMKDSALIINTARGGLVNEENLAAALENDLIAGAGFDVLSSEPPSDGHPFFALLDLPNFILTPHVAWASQQAMQTLADQLIANIENFVARKSVSV